MFLPSAKELRDSVDQFRFDIFWIVEGLDPSENTEVCWMVLLVFHLEVYPSGCYGMRLNITDYILKFFLNCRGRYMRILMLTDNEDMGCLLAKQKNCERN